MRQFFKYVFATVTGLFFFIFLITLLSSLIISQATKKKTVKVKPNTVLKMTFNSPLSDKTKQPSFNISNPLEMKEILGMNDILKNIDKATRDENVKGIYLNVSDISGSLSMIGEIKKALKKFQEAGKFIVSYSEAFGQKGYSLASISDGIYLNPEGFMLLTGFSVNMAFYKKSLDRLGVEPRIFYAGNFKSATEPFRLEKMSDFNRLQTRELLSDFYSTYLDEIAADRNIPRAQLHDIIDNAKVRNAKDAKTHGVVDDLYYYDQVESEIKERIGLDEDEKIEFLDFGKYNNASDPGKTAKLSKSKVAVIFAEGSIVMGKGTDDNIGGQAYAETIKKVREDKNVKAIVLRVNSGGGSALASEVMWREIMLAKEKGIPVVASMGGVAASGGYYISAPADKILAEPNTVTGSIGVFAMMAEADKFYADKFGMAFDTVKTGKFSDFPKSIWITRDLRPEENAIIQGSVDDIYDVFLKRVSDGRGMSVEEVHEIAQGRVWTGTQALENGLVDELGGLERAIEIAAEMANLEKGDYRLREYPRPEKPLEKLMKDLTASTRVNFLKEELGENYIHYRRFKEMTQMQGVQTRMPFEIDIY